MMTDRLLTPAIRLLEQSAAGRSCLRWSRRLRSNRRPDRPRVLCVGYTKTGTSSFGAAMRRLGYSHFGYERDLEASRRRGDLARCLNWAAHFDSFDDRPWFSPDFVSAFRHRFPGSYYVFLERDEAEWLRSYMAFTNSICSPMEALRRYHEHGERVLEVLKDEPHLLRMNVCAGEGYDKLCPFLGIAPPNEPFPWVRPRS